MKVEFSFLKKPQCFFIILLFFFPVKNIFSLADQSRFQSFSFPDSYYPDNIFRADTPVEFINKVYHSNIHSVQLFVEPLVLSEPVIPVNSDVQLRFGFDDLDGDVKNYYYTVIHCNSDWTPSDISNFDYIKGFPEQKLSDYQFSFNFYQKYIHYTTLIPNEGFQITLSGNYLLEVYLDNDPQKPVITKRFMVYDDKVKLQTEVQRATALDYTDTHQQVNFNILLNGLTLNNPFEEIKVTLIQNGRWDNAIYGLKPLFIKNDELDYHYTDENIFEAGKEFRNFDIRTYRYLTERVEHIDKEGSIQVFLLPDPVRSFMRYVYIKDINGKFIIDAQNSNRADLEAEYIFVHFQLPMDHPLPNGKLYVFGALSDWNVLPEYELTYNDKQKAYEAEVLLKQGFYDYEYIFVDKDKPFHDHSVIEGNYYETQNDYTVLVYYRPFGARYDQLVGVRTTNIFNR